MRPSWSHDHQSLIIGDSEDRPDQHPAAELDFGAGNDAARLVDDEHAETSDLLLGNDGNGHCNQADHRHYQKGLPELFQSPEVMAEHAGSVVDCAQNSKPCKGVTA